MKPESNFIEKFSIAVGVGSTLILAAYLIADSSSEDFRLLFVPEVESKAWTAVAAIPLLSFAYILGTFMLVIVDFCFQRFDRKGFCREWKLLEALAKARSDLLTHQFQEIIRIKRILEGSIIPLCLLGVGILCEIRNLPDMTWVLSISGVVVLLLAVSSPLFTMLLNRSLDRLEELASNIAPG